MVLMEEKNKAFAVTCAGSLAYCKNKPSNFCEVQISSFMGSYTTKHLILMVLDIICWRNNTG